MIIINKIKKEKAKEEKKVMKSFKSKLNKCFEKHSASTLLASDTKLELAFTKMRYGDVIVYANLYVGNHTPVLFYKHNEKNVSSSISKIMDLYKEHLEKSGFSVYSGKSVGNTHTLIAKLCVYSTCKRGD